MSTQRYEFVLHSDATCERVFDRLADIPNWNKWAGPLIGDSVLSRAGLDDPHGVGAIRTIGRRPVMSSEEIIEFDPPHHMAYTLVGGPLPVGGYRADVDITPDPSGGCFLRWQGSFDEHPPLLGALLRIGMKQSVLQMARRLAATA